MLSAAVKDKISELSAQGLSLKQVGGRVRLRPRTVSNVLRKWERKE